MKLEHAEVLFIHSTPSPILESSICCLGVKNFGEFPVPIINKSTESFVKSGNKNSLSISVISLIETSLVVLAEIKQGLFNFSCESDIEDSPTEIIVLLLAFCCVNNWRYYQRTGRYFAGGRSSIY